MPDSPLFFHRDPASLEIDIRLIDIRDRRPPHPGFDQAIDDRPVSPRPVPFPYRPLARLSPLRVAPPRFAPPPRLEEEVGRIEDPPALPGLEGPLDLERVSDGDRLDPRHGIPQGKRPKRMDPFGKGLEMGDHPVHGPVAPLAGHPPPFACQP